MKGRDSGMPEEEYWNSFFDAERMVRTLLGKTGCPGNLVEFGCGYGTFTFPAARHSKGTVYTFDIETQLIDRLRQQCIERKVQNIQAEVRDFVETGTGLEAETQVHAMIYNLLHLKQPVKLLKEAYRVLRPGGTLSVIHWRSDIPTPRGPALDIRPSPEQCREWMEAAGFHSIQNVDLTTCCPYHYGVVASR